MSQPVAVIGAAGRVGHQLVEGAPPGFDLRPVTRDPATLQAAGLRAPGAALPIVVCTRNDDLAQVLEAVHPDRHPDLVFLQNGMIRPWLAERGLSGCTQGVLWAAIPKVGAEPVPGGLSVLAGPWARPVAALLDGAGLRAKATSDEELRREIAVKLTWICVTGPPGSATGLEVGELSDRYAEDIRGMVAELVPLLAAEPGIVLDPDALFDRVQAYSAGVPHFRTAVKEWRWRNGWHVALARRLGRPTPRLDAWLERAGFGELLGAGRGEAREPGRGG